MEGILISVLYEQLNQGNKGERDWKPEAYHVVADALNTRMGLSINVDHVKNRLRVWKRHYNTITEIQTTTKFNWDNERKMVVINIKDMADWLKYCEENQEVKQYQNKSIENWDDICVLVGPNRAIGDELEHPEESATAMDVEAERSNYENSSSLESNKRLRSD